MLVPTTFFTRYRGLPARPTSTFGEVAFRSQSSDLGPNAKTLDICPTKGLTRVGQFAYGARCKPFGENGREASLGIPQILYRGLARLEGKDEGTCEHRRQRGNFGSTEVR